ncbi:glycosyltransferase [Intestinibacter sp.]|uniref:glycosyltransferase family 2 protein n=1 Tax=Intestinibacter sp. TaxID=1965304 RepID=UPI0025E9CC8A|nr:glycosyltransferase [uncultured Intestinibacter sp.]
MYLILSITALLISFLAYKINNKNVKLLIIVDIIISTIYILWRGTVIPTNLGIVSFILGLILFVCEFIGFMNFMNFQFIFFGKYKIIRKDLSVYNLDEAPLVDVLICTYNESLQLLEKTIIASTQMAYPKNKFKVYVCDDGRRDELKALCKKYGVNYITREDNKGAKAGNINNALKYIKGDLFLVLDADMIPKKEFLQKTIGYFEDENLAFVQTPQCYYNKDMYQSNLKKYIPNEQDFFMRDVQEARAYRGAVLHVGTNAVFRRKFIDEIGGYPTCSITEDMAVGMLLQAKGYDSIFINKVLVLGLSASTFGELVKQRDRWCRGNIQVFKHYNPFILKGLTPAQRICYVDGVLYWFSNLIKMFYIIVPILFLSTGIHFVESGFAELLNMTIPYILVQIFIFRILSPKSRRYMWTHYYEMAMAPHLSLSIIKEMFGFEVNFNVTSKDIEIDRGYYEYDVVKPHLLILILGLLSLFIGLKLVEKGYIIKYAYYLNAFLNIFNLIGIMRSLRVAYQVKVSEDEDRASIDEKMESNCILLDHEEKHLSNIDVVIDSISSKKIWIETSQNLEIGSKVLIKLRKSYVKCEVLDKHRNNLELKLLSLTKEQMEEVIEIYIQYLTPYHEIDKKQIFIEDKKKTFDNKSKVIKIA